MKPGDKVEIIELKPEEAGWKRLGDTNTWQMPDGRLYEFAPGVRQVLLINSPRIQRRLQELVTQLGLGNHEPL